MSKISVSSYSFMQYLRNGRLKLEDVPAKAKSLGYGYVEFLYMPGDNFAERIAFARKLKCIADSVGMGINAYTIGASLYQPTDEKSADEVERLCRQVDVAAELGCSVMRHDACYTLGKSGSSRSFGMMLPVIAENARAVTEYASGKGIKTCVENHGFIAQDSYRVEQLFNAVAHDNFGLLVDVGNFCCADEDCLSAVSRVAPYAVHVHVKDMVLRPGRKNGFCRTRAGNSFLGCVIGEGDCNAAASVRALKLAGYDGFFSVEFEGLEDCVSACARGRLNLKKMLEDF